LAGGFRVEGDCQLEPGQARNFTVQTIWWGGSRGISLEDSDQVKNQLKGLAALPMWFKIGWDSPYMKGVQKYWQIPPFGTGGVYGGEGQKPS